MPGREVTGATLCFAGQPYTAALDSAGGSADVVLDFPYRFPADSVERQLPDLASALALAGARMAPLEAILDVRRQQLASLCDNDPETMQLVRNAGQVIRIAFARMALRHGHWGHDLHAYHNEEHTLDLLGSRIDRLLAMHGIAALGVRDWCVLGMFAACHDLRQRELRHYASGVGANERASADEALRLLDQCGFCRTQDADLYFGLDLAIVGSTFDARPESGVGELNTAELVQSGGALATRLHVRLDAQRPGWREDAGLQRAHTLALIAADLDTANVAEPFDRFTASTVDLCREREMLSDRDLRSTDSAVPVMEFLTDGQLRFFFDLHRFNAPLGQATFAAAKAANGERLRQLDHGLRTRLQRDGVPESGDSMLAMYEEVAATLA